MIKKIYEAITGTPWTTSHSSTHDFGPPPGAEYAAELATFTDAQLLSMTRDEAIAAAQLIRAHRAEALQQQVRQPTLVGDGNRP